MPQTLHARVAVIGCFAAVTFGTSMARAQTSDAVYEDVKQIIEDLITEDASQTVAANLACLSAHQFVASGTPGAIDITAKGTGKPSDKFVLLDAVTYFPRTLQATYDMKFASLRPIVSSEVSAFVADLAYRLLKAPAAQAAAGANDLTKLRAFRANRRAVSPNAITPANANAIVFGLLSDKELQVCAANLTAELAGNQLANAGTVLDAECAAAQPNRDEYACDVAYAIQETLLNDSADAQGNLERALAELVGEVVLQKAPDDAQLTGVLVVVDAMLNANETTEAAVKAALASLKTATGQDQKTMTVLLTKMTDQWKAFHLTNGKALSVATFANWMGGSATIVVDACKLVPGATACTFFPHETSVLGLGSSVWPVIRLAVAGDEVDAAQLAIGELFAELAKTCHGTDDAAKKAQKASEDGCRMFPIYQRFLDATVVYVVEARSTGTPTDDARAALRTATEQLVEEVGAQGGIDRKALTWSGFLLPDLALRYAWSASNVNVGSGMGRTVASATWLKFRIPLFTSRLGYSAVTLSAADALAPFAEIATRATTATFNNSGRLAANLFAPRADLEGGIPALTKHLLVGGGLSLRMVAPQLTVPATATTQPTYEYRSCFHSGLHGDCFEFDLFVKYTI